MNKAPVAWMPALVLCFLAAPAWALDAPSEAERAQIDREIREDYESLAGIVRDAEQALRSYDAFTRALSNAYARNETLRLSCAETREEMEGEVVERLRRVQARSWTRCNASSRKNEEILAQAAERLKTVKKEVEVIQRSLDGAKSAAEKLRVQQEAADSMRSQSETLQNMEHDVRKVKSAPAF